MAVQGVWGLVVWAFEVLLKAHGVMVEHYISPPPRYHRHHSSPLPLEIFVGLPQTDLNNLSILVRTTTIMMMMEEEEAVD